ncbi:hypothetical protein Tco_1484711 [Tanacetum coccineum]
MLRLNYSCQMSVNNLEALASFTRWKGRVDEGESSAGMFEDKTWGYPVSYNIDCRVYRIGDIDVGYRQPTRSDLLITVAEEIENVKDEEGKNVEDQHGAVRSIGLAIKSDVAYFGREVRDIGTLRVYELWKPSFVSRIKTRGLPHPSPNRPNKKLKPIIVEVIITKLEELKV